MNLTSNTKRNFTKRICIILSYVTVCVLFITLFSTFQFASAESNQYYYITADTTLLIDNSQNKGAISLPKTYYVQKTNEADTNIDGEIFKTVIYNGVKGKIKESCISKKTTTVNNPYFITDTTLKTSENIKIMLKFYLPGSDEIVVGKELPPSTSLTFIAHTTAHEYFFVKWGEDYGYVEKAFCTPSDIVIAPNHNANNPDELQSGNSNLNNEVENKSEQKNNTVRIILICGICILAVLVVFLIFKPVKSKKPHKGDFYDM